MRKKEEKGTQRLTVLERKEEAWSGREPLLVKPVHVHV